MTDEEVTPAEDYACYADDPTDRVGFNLLKAEDTMTHEVCYVAKESYVRLNIFPNEFSWISCMTHKACMMFPCRTLFNTQCLPVA